MVVSEQVVDGPADQKAEEVGETGSSTQVEELVQIGPLLIG